MNRLQHTACVLLTAALLLQVFASAGCAPKEEPAPPPPKSSTAIDRDTPTPPQEPERTFFTHTVRWPGETLSLIAWWYTGDLENWRALAEANPDLKPERIRINDIILIPEDIMVKTDPLPKSFIDDHYGKSKDATAGAAEDAVDVPAQETNATAPAEKAAQLPGTERQPVQKPSPEGADVPGDPASPDAEPPAVELYGPKD